MFDKYAEIGIFHIEDIFHELFNVKFRKNVPLKNFYRRKNYDYEKYFLGVHFPIY